MNSRLIRTLAATLAAATTLSVLSGIDALARHQASSTASAYTVRAASGGERVASVPEVRAKNF